jgi:RND family efflux transporter MFP subunit
MALRPLALVAAVLVAGTAGCGRGGGGQQKGPPPLAVDVGQAQRQDVATYLTLDGQIAPLQESVLSLPQSGTVAAVYVNEGQHVLAGEVLAKLDDSTLQAQLAAAEAQVAQSTADMRGSALTVPITEQQTSSAVVSSQQQLAQAQNALTTAQSAYETAKSQYVSDEQLAKQGYLAKLSLDQARSAYVSAEQQLNSARAGVSSAQAALATAKRNTGQNAVQGQTVKLKEATLASASANVRLLQAQISQTTLTAPFGGVVTARLLDPGAFASPNQPIARVSQVDTVYVNANVPDDSLSYVGRGTPVTFTSPSVPGKVFSARVFDVNATPTTGTLSYRARLRVPNPANTLRGGMLVTVRVRKEFAKDAIVVPRTAVFTTDAGSSVYTVVDGKAKAIPVQVGLQTDTLAQVRGPGINPGTTVITTRPDALQDGSVVAVGGQPGAPGGPPAARGASSPSASPK